MFTVRIQVFFSREEAKASRPVFERILTLPDSIAFPFLKVVEVLKFLFGNSVVIIFEISS